MLASFGSAGDSTKELSTLVAMSLASRSKELKDAISICSCIKQRLNHVSFGGVFSLQSAQASNKPMLKFSPLGSSHRKELILLRYVK